MGVVKRVSSLGTCDRSFSQDSKSDGFSCSNITRNSHLENNVPVMSSLETNSYHRTYKPWQFLPQNILHPPRGSRSSAGHYFSCKMLFSSRIILSIFVLLTNITKEALADRFAIRKRSPQSHQEGSVSTLCIQREGFPQWRGRPHILQQRYKLMTSTQSSLRSGSVSITYH